MGRRLLATTTALPRSISFRHHRHNDHVFLYAFDLIDLNGDDVRRDPLEVRKATLRSMLANAGLDLRFNEHLEGDGRPSSPTPARWGSKASCRSERIRPTVGRSPDRLKMKNPERACRDTGGRRGMGAIVMAGDPGFWDLAWNWPLPFLTAMATLVVPIVGIIWFVCQLRYKQQIATLKNRVELADERLGDAKEKIVKAEEEKTALHTTVKELNAQIEKLKKRKAQLPRELQSIVDRLATSSAAASNQVSKLSEAQEAVVAAVSKHRDESHEGRAGH